MSNSATTRFTILELCSLSILSISQNIVKPNSNHENCFLPFINAKMHIFIQILVNFSNSILRNQLQTSGMHAYSPLQCITCISVGVLRARVWFCSDTAAGAGDSVVAKRCCAASSSSFKIRPERSSILCSMSLRRLRTVVCISDIARCIHSFNLSNSDPPFELPPPIPQSKTSPGSQVL